MTLPRIPFFAAKTRTSQCGQSLWCGVTPIRGDNHVT